jgi:hypothetical protein
VTQATADIGTVGLWIGGEETPARTGQWFDDTDPGDA